MAYDKTAAAECFTWTPCALVEKFEPDLVKFVQSRTGIYAPSGDVLAMYGKPYEVVESVGNLLTTAGLHRLTALIIGAAGQAATATATRLGTGNSSAAEAVGQTDLQAAAGSTNRWFQIMDSTYPQQNNGVLTFKSTFASADGNYVWNEWCVDIGTPTVASGATVNSPMVNRKVASLGTKASGAAWAFTATITIS